MLSITQVAKLLGIPAVTLRRLCRQGHVPGAQFIGGIWLLPADPVVKRPALGRPAAKEDEESDRRGLTK